MYSQNGRLPHCLHPRGNSNSILTYTFDTVKPPLLRDVYKSSSSIVQYRSHLDRYGAGLAARLNRPPPKWVLSAVGRRHQTADPGRCFLAFVPKHSEETIKVSPIVV